MEFNNLSTYAWGADVRACKVVANKIRHGSCELLSLATVSPTDMDKSLNRRHDIVPVYTYVCICIYLCT